MRIGRKGYNFVFNLLVAIIMSALMAFTLTLINAGFIIGFWGIWVKSFLIGTIVAFPVTYIAIPLVTNILKFMVVT